MKTGIHPTYYLTKVACACGNTFTTRSTRQELKLEICSACHPVFTGKQKFIDSAGRIDKFLKKFDQAKAHVEVVKKKKEAAKKAASAAKAVAQAKAAASKDRDKKAKVLTSRPTVKEQS